MNVLAAGQHARIPDRITTWPREDVFAVKSLEQTLHFHIGAHLLQTEAQIGKQLVEFSGINLDKTSTAAGPQPGRRELESELRQQVVEPPETVPHADATIEAGQGANHSADCGPGCLRDRAVQLHIGEHTVVIAFVNVVDGTAHGLSQQAGKGTKAIFFALKSSDVHKCGNSFFSCWWLADGVQTARKQSTLDLHQLAVDGTHQGIASVQFKGRCIVLRQIDVLIEIALTCRLDDRVDDLNAAATFAQLLVGAHQLTQFLQTSIEACVFGRRGEVADG